MADKLVNKLTIIKCGKYRNIDKYGKVIVNLDRLIQEKDGTTIYELMQNGKSYYDLKTLLNALIETGDIDNIARIAMFGDSKLITKEVFLKCAKIVVEHKDIQMISELSINCFGSLGFGNSFYVINEYMDMIKSLNDEQLINDLIKYINYIQKRETRENRKAFIYSLTHGEFEELRTGEYKPFEYMVYEEIIQFKKKLKQLKLDKQNKSETTIPEKKSV